MGWPMASNLAAKGFDVVAYDAEPARAENLAAEINARSARTIAELGAAAKIIVTMLPTGRDVRQVMLDTEGGLAKALGKGALLIDMSSADPIGTRELGAEIAKFGIAFVDAPVSGAVTGARAGTLTIMIGSDDAQALERAKPILNALGTRLFETGKLGSGHAMKALNNFCAAAGQEAADEALIVGQEFGLDPTLMIDILNVSTGRNFSTEGTIKTQVLTGEFKSGFALALLAKDVRIAADLANGLKLDAPMIQLAGKQWTDASDTLGPGKDHTEAYRYWQKTVAKKS
jgi:3-hydroxyisobutyrate dehydrogenase